MKTLIDLFVELGSRLSDFGRDVHSCRVIERAQMENKWFAPSDIRRAVEELRCGMLCRERLEAWLAHYDVPVKELKRVLVVMAGNIPLVGFFDLLCVMVAGHWCVVKPSAKDSVLMRYIVGLLQQIDPDARVSLFDGQEAPEAVIATGSDNANRYFRMHYAGLPSLLRGSRQSVAVLSGRETEEDLRGLSDDVFAYSGLGCRSVSLVFVPRGYELRVEMPAMNPKYTNNYRQTKALLEMEGVAFRDLGAAVLTESCEFPVELSRVNYAFYDTLAEVEQWLDAQDDALQCVVAACLAHPRGAGFGCAQSPALTDYPDARDVIDFLTNLNI